LKDISQSENSISNKRPWQTGDLLFLNPTTESDQIAPAWRVVEVFQDLYPKDDLYVVSLFGSGIETSPLLSLPWKMSNLLARSAVRIELKEAKLIELLHGGNGKSKKWKKLKT